MQIAKPEDAERAIEGGGIGAFFQRLDIHHANFKPAIGRAQAKYIALINGQSLGACNCEAPA